MSYSSLVFQKIIQEVKIIKDSVITLNHDMYHNEYCELVSVNHSRKIVRYNVWEHFPQYSDGNQSLNTDLIDGIFISSHSVKGESVTGKWGKPYREDSNKHER